MNDDQLRHCLRISLGSLAGYLFMHLTTWTTGLFFCVYPVLLLAMVPRMNGHAAFQFIAAAVINIVEVYLISGLFGDRPLLITPLVWALFAVRFHCMATGPYFLFGAQGLVAASVLFHFASYPDLDVTGMAKANLAAALLTGMGEDGAQGLLRLRQSCCDLRLLGDDASDLNAADSGKLSALLDMLVELVEEGRRVLLFSQFTSMLALEDLGYEEWTNVVDTNLTGAFLCTQAAFRLMKC